MSTDEPPALPYWWLISILFSTRPLSTPLALALHSAAFDLYRSDGDSARLDEPLLPMMGELRNLRKVSALGTITGPSFAAHVDTAEGATEVRFILTQKGIALMAERQRTSAN